jgi:predicted MPP superfamily phosphohydrolase
MKMQFAVFFGVFFLLYGVINLYIGWRGWQAFGRLLSPGFGVLYWLLFSFLALSFIAGRFGEKYLPAAAGDFLTVVGSYWLAAMDFFFLFILAIDIIRLVARWSGFLPADITRLPALTGLFVVLLVTALVIYGSWNSRNPRLVRYDLNIPKAAGDISELRVVMVSDIHLGRIIHNGRLLKLVQNVNNLNPDLVLLPGDIIDENIGPFVEQKMSDSLLGLNSKYGAFAVFGNHEYIGGHQEEAFRHLQEAGITVLRDSYEKIGESFYLVGQDERSRERFAGTSGRQLSGIMEGVDRTLPVLLMVHQPVDLAGAQEQGVDLQLSGHTHKGQLFPFNLLTKKIFETDWGYLRQGDFQLIVSCGFGTWGPPIRVGNVPEIVEIVIHFNSPLAKEDSIPVSGVKIMGRL